jgi:hypothetical protein
MTPPGPSRLAGLGQLQLDVGMVAEPPLAGDVEQLITRGWLRGARTRSRSASTGPGPCELTQPGTAREQPDVERQV